MWLDSSDVNVRDNPLALPECQIVMPKDKEDKCQHFTQWEVLLSNILSMFKS